MGFSSKFKKIVVSDPILIDIGVKFRDFLSKSAYDMNKFFGLEPIAVKTVSADVFLKRTGVKEDTNKLSDLSSEFVTNFGDLDNPYKVVTKPNKKYDKLNGKNLFSTNFDKKQQKIKEKYFEKSQRLADKLDATLDNDIVIYNRGNVTPEFTGVDLELEKVFNDYDHKKNDVTESYLKKIREVLSEPQTPVKKTIFVNENFETDTRTKHKKCSNNVNKCCESFAKVDSESSFIGDGEDLKQNLFLEILRKSDDLVDQDNLRRTINYIYNNDKNTFSILYSLALENWIEGE